MANNYSQGTGVLVLERITPVIEALFGGFNLANAPDEHGEVYLARGEGVECTWEDIGERLKGLINKLQISLPEDAEDTIEEYLYTLASHFKLDSNDELASYIENRDFDDSDPDFKELFDLAQLFDDEHGLTALRFETAFTCSRPRLFEFGGCGEFYGKHFQQISSSATAVHRGPEIDAAIASNDLDQAAQRLSEQVHELFVGVTDDEVRAQLKKKVAALLATS